MSRRMRFWFTPWPSFCRCHVIAGRRRRACPGTADRSAASDSGSSPSHPMARHRTTSARPTEAALCAGRQRGMVRPNQPAPRLPVHGLSFRDKKSLATASSPILACSERTVSSSASAGFRLPRSKIPAAPSSSDFFHSSLETKKRQTVASVTVRCPGSSSHRAGCGCG